MIFELVAYSRFIKVFLFVLVLIFWSLFNRKERNPDSYRDTQSAQEIFARKDAKSQSFLLQRTQSLSSVLSS